MAAPRHDFYQTDTVVTVSIFSKGLKTDEVNVELGERTLKVTISKPDTEPSVLDINPLYSSINKESSSFKILSTKLEVVLDKAAPGLRWPVLKGSEDGGSSAPAPISVASGTPAPAAGLVDTRQKSKWESYKPNEEDLKANENPDDFFKMLFKDADEDTRRAMMKSYQESNGTALSTNWSEVKTKKYPTEPPSGMVAKRYGID